MAVPAPSTTLDRWLGTSSIYRSAPWDIHPSTLPRAANLLAEDDRISGFGSDLYRDFIQFTGELSTDFVRQHAQV